MSEISLRNIDKVYPNKVQAVFDFNLDIKDKEFVVFVGPSGCGKSTTLRMIAGLEEITRGELFINGQLMNAVEPKDRNIAMVFQNYALYPHMTVYKNMEFALKLRKIPHTIASNEEDLKPILAQIDGVRSEIVKIDKELRKNENNFDRLSERTDLVNQLLELNDKYYEKLQPVLGIDEYGIKVNKAKVKRVSSDLEDLNKRIEKAKAKMELWKDDEKFISKANDFLANAEVSKRQKELTIEEAEKQIDYLSNNDVPLYKMKKSSRREMYIEINRAAEILDLSKYLYRKPSALSGGQRQRVALGRAIVRKPSVFLMDEPLSNLDAKLRIQTRSEISKLHKRVGATTIYVTHDQTEAMTMADRIVIMRDGYIQQIGTPDEVYDDPANKFVGGFIGAPAMNFIKCKCNKDKLVIEKAKDGEKNISLALSDAQVASLKEYVGKEIYVGIRPEKMLISKEEKKGYQSIKCKCDFTELLGYELIVYTEINGQNVAVKVNKKDKVDAGDNIILSVDENSFYFFDVDTEKRIYVNGGNKTTKKN